MDFFVVWRIASFLVVALVIAISTASLFLFLGLPLKGSTIVGVVSGIFPMQKTVELLFSVYFVAGFATAFLVPTGFVFVKQSLIG